MAIGQFFSQRFGYAVHALAYVARKPAGELTTLPELASWMGTIWPNSSESYLSNIVQRLARGRLLRSQRGIAGGYSLGRAAAKISLRDLVDLLEGAASNRSGHALDDNGPVPSRCSIQQKLIKLDEGYLQSLEQMTIEELSKDIVITLPKKTRR